MANGPADRTANGPADRTADRTANRTTNRTTNGPADRTADRPTDRSLDWGPLFAAVADDGAGSLLAEEARAALARAIAEAERRIEALGPLEAERRAAEAEVARASRLRDESRDAEAEARARLAEAASAWEAARGRLERVREEDERSRAEMDALCRELEGPLVPFSRWKARADEALLSEVRAAVEARRSDEQVLARALEAEQQLRPSISTADVRLTEAARRVDEVSAEESRLEGERRSLRERRATFFQGEALAHTERRLASALAEAKEAARQAAEEVEVAGRGEAEAESLRRSAERACAQARRSLGEAEARLAEALGCAGIDERELRARAVHDPAEIAAWRAELERLDRAREQQHAVVAERVRRREAHESEDPPAIGREQADADRSAAERRMIETRELQYAARSQIERDDVQREQAQALRERVGEQRARLEVWETLCQLIGSASGNKLRVFAQSLTLELLLDHANHHLRDLSPRYALARVPGEDLALQIVDHEMGDEIRSVGSLSGGESFLVALGLALGLASLSSQRSRIDSLFIDEGFGSLDPASLEMVLATLDTLQASGRQVGVISHVPAISERFDTRVQVVAAGPARSRVELVTGFAQK